MPLPPGIIQSLFTCEDNPNRFERVCIDLYNDAYGITLLPTSKTYDRGRDARDVSILYKGKDFSNILCATLTSSTELDVKVEKDIKRLAETSKTKAIVYCSSQSLTEDACDKIKNAILTLYPRVETVQVLGQIQLIALGQRFEDVLQIHYAAEIHSIEQAFFPEQTTFTEPDRIGLRLALITQTGNDANALRNELTKRLMIDKLKETGPLSSQNLAVNLSELLHLPKVISKDYIETVLSQLLNDEMIEFVDNKAKLTKKGVDFSNSIPLEATCKLLEGRVAIRDAIKQLSGYDLTDEHYGRLWRSLQEELTELFYSHGLSIVKMVSSLVSGEHVKPEPGEQEILKKLSDRLIPIFSNQVQGQEICQAIVDMFSEKNSDAFQWLTQICSVYVMMCSLGLEPYSGHIITKALRSFKLVVDSDVVISLLCEKEDNHDEITRIINNWRAFGGKVLMAKPVLEEVAYHAWISENEYSFMKDTLSEISEYEVRHFISNAFLRTFKLASSKLTARKYWDSYINQYRGESERDYSAILNILRDEYGFDILPDADTQYQQHQAQYTDFLIKRMCETVDFKPDELDYKKKDKCRRDGLLFINVQSARDSIRRSGMEGSIMILSSSRLLKEADEVFRKELGNPDAVISTAAVGCLLTLVPGVHMGLETLKGVLFDVGLAERLNPLQRNAYKLIAASGEFSLPISRRVTLNRELVSRLVQDAKASGQTVEKMKNRVLKSEDPEYSAKVIADTLDKMAVTTESQKEMYNLRNQVKELQQQLQKEKEKKVNTPKKL
ncbi:MAG: hypothetical protein ACE14V_04900 [bacterium]